MGEGRGEWERGGDGRGEAMGEGGRWERGGDGRREAMGERRRWERGGDGSGDKARPPLPSPPLSHCLPALLSSPTLEEGTRPVALKP